MSSFEIFLLFINCLMRKGKKEQSYKILMGVLNLIHVKIRYRRQYLIFKATRLRRLSGGKLTRKNYLNLTKQELKELNDLSLHPLIILCSAIRKSSSVVYLRPQYRGKNKVSIPLLFDNEKRRLSASIRNIIFNSNKRYEKNVTLRLFGEIMDIFFNRNSRTFKAKKNLYKSALNARGFLKSYVRRIPVKK